MAESYPEDVVVAVSFGALNAECCLIEDKRWKIKATFPPMAADEFVVKAGDVPSARLERLTRRFAHHTAALPKLFAAEVEKAIEQAEAARGIASQETLMRLRQP